MPDRLPEVRRSKQRRSKTRLRGENDVTEPAAKKPHTEGIKATGTNQSAASPKRKKPSSASDGASKTVKLKRAATAKPATGSKPAKKQKVSDKPRPDKSKPLVEKDNTSLSKGGSQKKVNVDKRNKEASEELVKTRKTYSREEDKLLILCRIALGVMNKTTGRNPYPFNDVRKVVLEYYCEDGEKTSKNYQMRLGNLMKNNVKNTCTVKICVTELLEEKEFQGLDDPNLPFSETFYSTAKRIIERSRTRASHVTDVSQLSSSLDELYRNFTVKKLVLSGKNMPSVTSMLGPPISEIKDIRLSVARDLIQVACNTTNAKFDAFNVIRMFDKFSDDEIETAFKEMQSLGLINRKRENPIGLKRSLPFAAMSYNLSNTYYRLFREYKMPAITFDGCARYNRLLEPLLDDGEESGADSRDSDTASTPQLEFNQSRAAGGHVACLLALLINGKITTDLTIPDEIIGASPHDGDKEVLSQAATSKGRPKEVAGLPKLPQKRKTKEKTGNIGNKKLSTAETKQDKETSGADSTETNGSSTSQPGSKTSSDSRKKQTKAKDVTCFDPDDVTSTRVQSTSKGSRKEHSLPQTKAKGKSSQVPSGKKTTTQRKEVPKEIIEVSATESKGRKGKETSTVKYVKGFEMKSSSHLRCTFYSPYDLSCALGRTPELICKGEQLKALPGTSKTPRVSPGSATTLPTQRPSRISLMMSRSASMIQSIRNKTYNNHDLTFLNTCTIMLRPTSKSAIHGKGHVDTASDLTEVSAQKKAVVTADESMATSNVSMDTSDKRVCLSDDAAGKVSKPEELFSLRHALYVGAEIPTLEIYLVSCVTKDAFNETDVALARFIWQAAVDGEQLGITIPRLKAKVEQQSSTFVQASCTVEEHLQRLYRSRLLWRFGTYEEHAVANDFIKPWCLEVIKTSDNTEPTQAASNEETAEKESEDDQTGKQSPWESISVIGRPWLMLNGDINKEFMISLMKAVVSVIMENPSITEVHLMKRFMDSVRPVSLTELLEFLERRQCIARHTVSVPKTATLFSTATDTGGSQQVAYWVPDVDCISNAAKIISEMTE